MEKPTSAEYHKEKTKRYFILKVQRPSVGGTLVTFEEYMAGENAAEATEHMRRQLSNDYPSMFPEEISELEIKIEREVGAEEYMAKRGKVYGSTKSGQK